MHSSLKKQFVLVVSEAMYTELEGFYTYNDNIKDDYNVIKQAKTISKDPKTRLITLHFISLRTEDDTKFDVMCEIIDDYLERATKFMNAFSDMDDRYYYLKERDGTIETKGTLFKHEYEEGPILTVDVYIPKNNEIIAYRKVD